MIDPPPGHTRENTGRQGPNPALVLVTGAAGNLGRALIPGLAESGYAVRALDLAPLEAPAGIEVIGGDLRQPETLQRAVDGVQWVVHGAAWHGIHLRDHPPVDFWELNVDATFYLYQAAERAGIQGIVLSSTMGVYGESGKARAGKATRVQEHLPLLPDDVYGLTKVIDEEVAAAVARQQRMPTVALRFGMFVPETFPRYGVRLLYGGVDPRDVASAVLAALTALEDDRFPFAAFNIESALPFDDTDADDLVRDPMKVVARYWPSAQQLLASIGADLWGPIERWFDIRRAEKELGWKPRFGFTEFLDAVATGRLPFPADDGLQLR